MTLHLPKDGCLRAITVREPFATLIAMGFKTIENRIMRFPATLPLPCTVAIHASFDDTDLFDNTVEVCKQDRRIFDAFNHIDAEGGVPGKCMLYSQVILGLVDVVACVDVSDCVDDEEAMHERLSVYPLSADNPAPDVPRVAWAHGPYCYVLDNARRFRQGINTRGQLGLWRVSPEMQATIAERMTDLITGDLFPLKPSGGVCKPLGKPLGSSVVRRR